ncbi:hypothetical protein [Halobacterium rubrum]|uniref:hypothetical protein n=1 Tax=Halobacterium TaxID=2239 RepID=UPI001F390690|nr:MULTISPECIES: hypothetical protein [Halobacterium]MDH5021052.1 hypothetical protein [Halobacterium rubrum]
MSRISEVSLSPLLIPFEDTFEREPGTVWTLEEQHHTTDDASNTPSTRPRYPHFKTLLRKRHHRTLRTSRVELQ